jgi:hypothetical protein
MSDAMQLTLQLTDIGMLLGVLFSAKQHIQSLGEVGKKVQKDFEVMSSKSVNRWIGSPGFNLRAPAPCRVPA